MDLRGSLTTSIDPQNPVRPKFDDAIEWWTKLLDKVKDAPLYPLERLADRLTSFIGYLTNLLDIQSLLTSRHAA